MFEIVILIILIGLNALFASIEMAFVSLNDVKIANMSKEGNKKAIEIEKMLKSPSRFLATIQIGITFAGFLSSAFASDTFADKLAPLFHKLFPFLSYDMLNAVAIILITILLSCLMLIFGELVPKRIAMKHSEKISFKTINFLNIVSVITYPFVYLLMKVTNVVSKLFGVGEHDEVIVTEEEIRMVVDHGEEKGAILEYEKEFINNVLEFNDKGIEEVIIKKEDIFGINVNISFESLVKILSEEGYKYSRIPVFDEEDKDIVGILYVKDILKNLHNKKNDIKKIMVTPIYIKKSKYINEVFKRMQKNNLQIAVITDYKNASVGIVTMDDILAQIVGDIHEEHGNE